VERLHHSRYHSIGGSQPIMQAARLSASLIHLSRHSEGHGQAAIVPFLSSQCKTILASDFQQLESSKLLNQVLARVRIERLDDFPVI
jgi:hypothetical protein